MDRGGLGDIDRDEVRIVRHVDGDILRLFISGRRGAHFEIELAIGAFDVSRLFVDIDTLVLHLVMAGREHFARRELAHADQKLLLVLHRNPLKTALARLPSIPLTLAPLGALRVEFRFTLRYPHQRPHEPCAHRDRQRDNEHGIAHPPIILNTAHAQSPLPETAVPHTVPGHHVFTGAHEELLDTLSQRSDLWVQDPASSLAVGSVADLRPRVIIDPCAGLGTKTRQLQATFPNASIIASDVDRLRYATLSKVFSASDQVRVIPYERLREHAGTAELILLDVPCSNTGVLARRPEARHRFDRERLESLTGVQRQIIADSIPLLASAGRILYSTCSLDAAENEEQAKWAARWHSLSVSRESRRRPEGGPGQPPERYTDGAYSVLIA